MAAAVEMPTSSPGPSSYQARNPNNIRYSDVANYVSLSLLRDPSQSRGTPKRQQSVPALSTKTPPGASASKDDFGDSSRADALPTIQANRADHLRCQLEWLKAEQRAEKEQLRRLESSLSDSMLLERKAQKRVMKHKEMRDFHNQRVQDVETKIGRLRGELEAQHVVQRAPRPSPQAMAVEKRNRASSPRQEAWRSEDAPQPIPAAEVTGMPVKQETVLPPLEADVEEQAQQKGTGDRSEPSDAGRQNSPPRRTHYASDSEVTLARRSRKTTKVLDASDVTHTPEDAQYSDEDCPEGAISNVNHRSGPNTPVVGRPAGSGGGWIKQYMNMEAPKDPRFAKWQPANPDEKIGMLLEAAQLRSEGAAKKKWMSSTFRRLKTRGKSDARCREVVALHLPRGSGPKDREDVPIFSQTEVRACKKMYTDSYMDPVKRIQKAIVEMKESKRDLRSIREELFSVTEARLLQQRAEEERKNAVQSIGGLGLLAKVKDPLAEEAASSGGNGNGNSGKKSFKKLGEENGMEEDAVTELFREYLKFADSSENLGRKAFTRLLQALCPSRTLVESDLEAWWGQISRSSQDAKSAANARRTQCKFEEFISWYAHSEART